MIKLSLTIMFAAALGTITGAAAQPYPSRPITMIVPFAAGGPNDTIGRIMAERMRAPLGQPVIIENVVGANGTIGVGRAARAAPDGYTLSMGGFNSHVVNGAVYALAYDVLRDFDPVAVLSSSGGGLIVARKTLPANDLKGLIAWPLVCVLGASRHTEARRRQAQCRSRGCLGGCDGSCAARRPRAADFPARAAST
jgi:tripartite-type tricarboxylate transporter receptor subunit TctC